jgi:uncharacterized protein YdeI (YjbR/CyaY-like superfamily)
MKTFYAKDRAAWRAWLRQNAYSADEIWLVFYKKNSGQPTVTYPEAVEEALCFGWIDTKVKTMDELRYRQRFTPRNPRSSWSPLNIERAQRMIAEGKMTPAGLRAFEHHEDRRTPPHPTKLPSDLDRRFRKNSAAWKNFQGFPPGYQRMTIGWVAGAKKRETQDKRLDQLIEFSARNERLKFI